jgi:hypothetical protein
MIKYPEKVREIERDCKSEYLIQAILSKKVRERGFYLSKKKIPR